MNPRYDLLSRRQDSQGTSQRDFLTPKSYRLLFHHSVLDSSVQNMMVHLLVYEGLAKKEVCEVYSQV